MNYINTGLKKTLNAIKKNKGLFLIIVLLQIIFVTSLVLVGTNYQGKILENAQKIIEPLQNSNLDAESIKAGNPFTTEIALVYENYNSMMKNITILMGWLLVILGLLNGLIWILSHQLLKKRNLKGHLKIWLKLIISSTIIMGVFISISYAILISILRIDPPLNSLLFVIQVLSYIFILFYYFQLISFALVDLPWKLFVKKWFLISIKKVHQSLLILLINLVLIFLTVLSIYFTVNYEKSVTLLLFTGILFVGILVLTRIFWIASIQALVEKHEKNHN